MKNVFVLIIRLYSISSGLIRIKIQDQKNSGIG